MPLSVELLGVEDISIEFDSLYEDEFNGTVWNDGDDLPEDYQDYGPEYFDANNNSLTIPCMSNNSDMASGVCYLDNMTGFIWVNVPHFSGVAPQIHGQSETLFENATITKSVVSSPVTVGGIAQFTINVTNTGTANLTGVEVSDDYNVSHLNYSGFSSASPNIAISTINYTAGEVDWNFNLTVGSSLALTVNFTTLQEGNTTNFANVLNSTYDDLDVDSDWVLITAAAPDVVNLTFTKTAVQSSVENGDTAQFILNVTNVGGVNVTGYVLMDDYNTTLLNYSGASITEDTVNYSEGELDWEFDLNISESFVVTVNFTTLTIGNTTNSAEVVNESDDTIASDTADLEITAPAASPGLNLTFSKTAVESSVENGDIAQFILNVTNIGSENATDFFVGDFYNTSFLDYSWSNVSYDEFNDTEGEIWWEFSLTTGSTFSILVNFSTLTTGNTTNEALVENSTMATLYTDDADLEITAAAAPPSGGLVGDFYFEFNGTVYNSDGTQVLSGVNVSIEIHNYSLEERPPIYTYNTTSNGTGWYNQTLPGFNSWTATYTPGFALENSTHMFISKPMPLLYYPEIEPLSPLDVYLQEATRLNITVVNESGGAVNFNYQVKDSLEIIMSINGSEG
ncbi:hypothetical protein ACFL3V_07430 [Nanoarchaeota archaeon]